MTAPLSRSARGLIEQAVADERALRADDARRARLKRALLSGAAASGAGLLGSSTSQAATGAQAASAVAPLLPLVKGLGVGLLLSGAIAGSWHVLAEPSSPTHVVVEKPAELPPVASQVPAVALPESVAPSAPVKARAVAPAAVTEPPPPSPSVGQSPALGAELELMSQVQAALRDNRGARALSLLARYDDSFPRGQLGTERLAAEVFAACQVGDVTRARGAATRFLARDASSPLAERVKGACAKAEYAP